MIIQKVFRIVFKTVEIISPGLAGKWAVTIFFTPQHFKRPYREQEFIKNAKSSQVPFSPPVNDLYDQSWAIKNTLNKNFNDATPKTFYQFYEMGEGPTVLLVHGWSGRASQMGSIAQALVEAGFRVVSFDAFAHGESPGKQTTVLEFVEIIKDVNKRCGPFNAVIGHSLGGIAAGKAIVQGLKTEKLITIGSSATIQFLFESFCDQVNASKKTLNYLKNFVEAYAKRDSSEFSLVHFAQFLDVKGLIMHDRDDKEIAVKQSEYINKAWQKGHYVETEGLGHVRILRDKNIIDLIVKFIQDKK